VSLWEQFLCEVSIFPKHTSMMDSKSKSEKVFDLLIGRLFDFFLDSPRIFTIE
jgi:hypothetical protein